VSPLCKALKELKWNIPIYILVTDPYSVSPVWFYNRDLFYIVYSEEAKKLAIGFGVPKEKVFVFKQIVNYKRRLFLYNSEMFFKNHFQDLPKDVKSFRIINKDSFVRIA
jgi:hypothetical protein